MSLAAKRLEQPGYPNMAMRREALGFRLVAVMHERPRGQSREERKPSPKPVEGEPANALCMDASGGAGNAFGAMPLLGRMEDLESTLAHVRGEREEKQLRLVPQPGADERMPASSAGVLKGWSPLLGYPRS